MDKRLYEIISKSSLEINPTNLNIPPQYNIITFDFPRIDILLELFNSNNNQLIMVLNCSYF